jgi:hypothetical protein
MHMAGHSGDAAGHRTQRSGGIAGGLPALLEGEEQWARAHVPFYAPRPDGLKFVTPQGPIEDGASLRQGFLHAIRVNESVPTELYVQRPPGSAAAADALDAQMERSFPAADVSARVHQVGRDTRAVIHALDTGDRELSGP